MYIISNESIFSYEKWIISLQKKLRMSILIVYENKNPNLWRKKLKEKLSKTKIEIYPTVKDPTTVDFVVCWKPKENCLTQFPNIKVIQSVGASIDHITTTQDLNENIVISRIIDENLSNDMWEFLLSVVLSQLKNKEIYVRQQNSQLWKQQDYQSIHNTAISILGLGKIGGHVAEQFAKLGFKVKGWSNSKKQIQNVKSFTAKEEFDDFLKESNFLINLLPLTDDTEDILNKDTFSKLPKGTFLINVGRGEHLVEQDLIKFLDNSHLSGALLDVFREEPLSKGHQFWVHPKIQITPHIASLTNVDSAVGQIIENYQRFRNSKELLNKVSLNKGY